jgi:hypothetical protein
VAAVSRQSFSSPKTNWYDQSITHETNPRGGAHLVSRDAQYAGVLRAQISSYCPLRGMQQRGSEQAGATNGAVYRARRSYNGKFSVNFSAVKTRWVEF